MIQTKLLNLDLRFNTSVLLVIFHKIYNIYIIIYIIGIYRKADTEMSISVSASDFLSERKHFGIGKRLIYFKYFRIYF